MELYTPAREEVEVLLTGPTRFRGFAVADDALPPRLLLERAVTGETNRWQMPRLFVDIEQREIVGSACFKTKPKERQVEIGYGVSPHRRSRGFATKGVALMVEEAFSSNEVDSVLAASVPTNTASKRVLEKSGFEICGSGIDEDEGPVELWRKARKPNQISEVNGQVQK